VTRNDRAPLDGAPRIHWKVHAFGSVGSTNDIARRLAHAGAPEGTVVLAERQRRGRGRRGSVWVSPPGGLWFSLVLRPHLAPERAAGLSVVAAIAVARAARGAAGVAARIKWPNDVLVSGRKLAGAMAERAGSGALVLGVGLNLNLGPEELPALEWYEATSLAREAGRRFMRAELLALIVREFEPRYFRFRSSDHHTLVEEWRELSLVVGEQVVVTREGREIQGTAHGLDDDGALVLRLHDGRQERVLPTGEVTLRVLAG